MYKLRIKYQLSSLLDNYKALFAVLALNQIQILHSHLSHFHYSYCSSNCLISAMLFLESDVLLVIAQNPGHNCSNQLLSRIQLTLSKVKFKG